MDGAARYDHCVSCGANMIMINIAREFSRFPAGRFFTDGPFSGEKFREEFLMPIVSKGEAVEVDLDGVAGYGSSFLEEAFGGLVRKLALAKNKIDSLIRIKTEDESLLEEVRGYMVNSALK